METETVKLSKTERLLITNLELLVKRVREAHVDADGLVNDCPVCVSLVLSEEAIKSAKKNSSHYELLEGLQWALNNLNQYDKPSPEEIEKYNKAVLAVQKATS